MASEVIGRNDEIEQLRAFLDAEAIDGPRALVLEGEAGIGKSTLWLAGVEIGLERGALVLQSRPSEAEREFAFAGLGDLFDDVLEHVLRTLPPPRRRALEVALLLEEASEPADPRALGVAVRTGLETLAAEQPLLLAIDDVQWLDASSASALSFALRRLEAPIALLLARRLAEGIEPSALERILPDERVERLFVSALSLGALQTLLRDRLERVFARPTLLRIHELSGGNPFYGLELGRALPEDVDPTEPLSVPDSLGELLRVRLAVLPEPTRRALALCAALGNAPDAALEALGVSRETLEPALAARVVERESGSTRFTHPLIASTLYQDLPAEERRDLHRRLAAASHDALDSAHHLALASDTPDVEIASVLEEASTQAGARGTMVVAASLAEHALRLTPADAFEDRDRRTIAAARAHFEAGDARRAQVLAHEALDRSSGGARADALVLMSDVEFGAGHVERAMELRREALEAAADRPSLQAQIHQWLGGNAALTESTEVGREHALVALRLAESLDDEALRAGALAVLAGLRFRLGEPGALELAEEAAELAAASGSPRVHRYAMSGLIHAAVWSHQLDRARVLLEERDREWSARDELVRAWNLWFLGLLELRAGRFRLAAEHADQARDIRRQYALDDREDMSSVWLVALIAAHRGQLTRARAVLETYSPSIEGTWLHGVLGLVELWSGHPDSAVSCFESVELGTRAVRGGPGPALAWWRADHAQTLVELGRLDEAVALLDAWEADAVRLGRDAWIPQVTRCRGLVAAASGEFEPAAAELERSAEQHEAVGDPFGRARTLLALGIVRRRARQKRAAREAIIEALTLFEECGADGWVEKARAEVGRIGGRKREEGLTDAERRVAALVATGRTNREVAATLVVTERTVETHLTHIYSKLGIRSRAELARTFAIERQGGEQSSGVSTISS